MVIYQFENIQVRELLHQATFDVVMDEKFTNNTLKGGIQSDKESN